MLHTKLIVPAFTELKMPTFIRKVRIIRGAPDQDPDPAGSKQSGSGQPDSLPCSSTNHCKHALCFITQCQTKTSDKLH